MKTISRRVTPRNMGPAGIVWPKPIAELEAMPLFCYGASYEAQDLQCTVNNRALLRLQGRHRMGTLVNNALSGSGADSMATRAIGNSANKWTSGTKGLIYVNPLHNSMFFGGYTAAKAIASINDNTHALLACLASASRVEATAATKTGTWTVDTNAQWSAGSAATTTTTGDTCDFAVTVNATGIVDVILGSVDAASTVGVSFPPGPFTVWVDGVQVGGTLTTADHVLDTGSTVENAGLGKLAVTLTGLSAGAHTIRVKKEAGAGTTYIFVDCVFVRSTTPPPVLLAKMPQLDWTTVALYGYGHTVTDAEVAAANAFLDSEAAAFGNIIVFDPSVGWSYAKHIGADFIHPNDRGMAHYCNKAEQAVINALGWRAGLHTGVS